MKWSRAGDQKSTREDLATSGLASPAHRTEKVIYWHRLPFLPFPLTTSHCDTSFCLSTRLTFSFYLPFHHDRLAESGIPAAAFSF